VDEGAYCELACQVVYGGGVGAGAGGAYCEHSHLFIFCGRMSVEYARFFGTYFTKRARPIGYRA